jgi:protein gp37
MRDLLNNELAFAAGADHIWWGVSVEDKKYGVPRIEDIRRANVRVRFLSIEPLLEDIGLINLEGIHWAIVGGESGPGARPMAPEWVESLFFQCGDAGVHFFFKQWGGVQKKKTGRTLHNRTFDDMPVIIRESFPGSRTKRKGLVQEVINTFNATEFELCLS